jgi:Flp pilus assembly protein TadD
MAEAEQAYVATVAADPKVGEAHNNLAVVYLETGRYAEAEKAVKAAEAAGLRVQPALKEEIVRRKKGTL